MAIRRRRSGISWALGGVRRGKPTLAGVAIALIIIAMGYGRSRNLTPTDVAEIIEAEIASVCVDDPQCTTDLKAKVNNCRPSIDSAGGEAQLKCSMRYISAEALYRSCEESPDCMDLVDDHFEGCFVKSFTVSAVTTSSDADHISSKLFACLAAHSRSGAFRPRS